MKNLGEPAYLFCTATFPKGAPVLYITTTEKPVVAPIKTTPSSVIRNIIVDCSGSMYSDMGPIRYLLKGKIPQVAHIGDRINLITFASRGDCTVVVQDFEINKAADFKTLNAAIDKGVHSRGCTGFVDPLKAAASITQTIKDMNPGLDLLGHVFFMTDGYDNCWSQKEILSAMTEVGTVVDAITIVEFGWYCNRDLLTRMAETVGASLIFSEDFSKYEGAFLENIVKSVGPGTSRVSLTLASPTSTEKACSFAFYLDSDDSIVNLEILEGNQVKVPEYVERVYSFTDAAPAGFPDPEDKVMLAGVVALAQRALSHEAIEILGRIGDVALIDAFCNCFSKQDYSEFQDKLLTCIKDEKARFVAGRDTKYLPADDAFTVVDLLEELSKEGNLFYPHDPSFKYERISAARVDANTVVSDEEKEAATKKLQEAKTADELKAASEELQALSASKVSVKFKPAVENNGYALDGLVYNEKRPNISLRVFIPGSVALPEDHPFKDVLPPCVRTHVYRNYNIVHDGIKHSSLKSLSVSLTESSFDVLKSHKVIPQEEVYEAGRRYYINASLPVLNRNMTKIEVSAKEFFEKNIELISWRSAQKVYNSLLDSLDTTEPSGFATVYGAEAAQWLKERGITDGGFNPPSVKGESLDEYQAKEFKVLVKGCSSIPKIDEDLFAKIQKGKLTPSVSLCAPWLQKYWAFENSKDVTSAADPVQIKKAWLWSEVGAATKNVRTLLRDISKTKIAVMVGHIWFKEFSSREQNTMDVVVNGMQFTCTADLKDITVKI